MVEALEIHHLSEAGQVQLGWTSGNGRQTAPPVAFQNPLADSDYGEIGWYLQEYLDYPFGAASARAEAIETGLGSLGRVLFQTIFRGNEESFRLYSQATVAGLGECTLAIISDQPEFLALPWELMNEPGAGYLVTQMASVTRRVDQAPPPVPQDQASATQFNILLVSPMPASGPEASSPENSGPADPGAEASGGNTQGSPGQQATETIKVLESLNIQVELDYLRPPTWESLSRILEERSGHYHLVHFDGITIAPDAAGNSSEDSEPASIPALGPNIIFEDEQYQADPVAASRVAELLLSARVPLVVLAAASQPNSGDVPRLWSAAGQVLAQAGIPQVVILPHALHGADTTEQFLQQIYQALTQGSGLGTALAQARRGLMDEPHRLTLTGKKVFWDWITPQMYESGHYVPPVIEEEQPDPLAPPVIPGAEEEDTGTPLPAAGQYGLVGRTLEIRQLERLFQRSPVVLLSGDTGAGKTELALGISRWCQRTLRDQLPGGVFYSTFEASHPAGLERIIHEIGTSAAGLEFADMNSRQQRHWVLDYLQNRPSLLVWDNIQNVAGDGAQEGSGLLSLDEQSELNEFIAQVTQGGPGSRILLVSQHPSLPWLTTGFERQTLAGLLGHARQELAARILEKASIESARVTPDCLALLDLLEGHPLAMQIALPLLKEVPASVLLGEIRREIEEMPGNAPENAKEEGRPDYLTAVMEYSWSKMTHRSRTHLPMLALFQRRAMMDILNHITQEGAYRNVMGEELGWGACRTMLRTAQAAGFLDPISPSVYQIHQALPWFYGRKLTQQLSGPAIRQLELEFLRVYADTADYFMESLYENQASGVTAILAEEGNLTQALGLALEAKQWDDAQLLVQPLAQVYRMQKRYPELQRLRGQLLESVGVTAADAVEQGSIELWVYLQGTAASEATELLDLNTAEALNQQLLDHLIAQPEGEQDPRTAAVYHQFGIISLNRRQWDEASGSLQKSLEIIEDGEDQSSVADDYYALGQVRQGQRLYTEAKEWYQKALDVHQRLPDEEEMVKDYRALGMICHLKFEYQEAQSWYYRARDMVEESRDEETAVQIYHALGNLCHAQYLYDEAQDFYQQALDVSDRHGNRKQMVVEFHHLGLLSQSRGILYDEAEDWYHNALAYLEELGDRRGVGDECRQLGVLFHEQKRYDDALKWYTQAREIFEELGDVQRIVRTYGQLGMIAEEQDDLQGALEWVARTHQLVVEHDLPVIVQVKAHLARLRDKYGDQGFQEWWQDFTGEPAPADLDVDTSFIL